MRSTQQVYAMKIMNKWDMLRRGEVHTHTTPNKDFLLQMLSWDEMRQTLWFKMDVLQWFVAQCDHHLAICLPTFIQLSLCHTDSVLPGGEGGFTEGGQMLDHRAALRLSGWQLSGAYEWTRSILVYSIYDVFNWKSIHLSSLSTWWWITMSGGTCWPCSVSLETGSLKTWLSSTWLRWSWPLTLSTDWVMFTGRPRLFSSL